MTKQIQTSKIKVKNGKPGLENEESMSSHCERSEAIPWLARPGDCFARNDSFFDF
ncbi:MAG: hypothetical protein HY673_12295 [Chloroflexi bacterium]|nr:hypothetical protein [Chloroflexota bacterium]